MQQNYSRIIGIGSYLPPKVVTNDDLAKFVDTSDEWISSRTGISQRHFVETEKCSDLAYEAAKNALLSADFSAEKLDAIIVATTTADKVFPSVACNVQYRIGARGCCSFDVQAVCAGFMYALGIADSMIKAGQYKNVLVIGSETMSKLMDWEDRSTCVLFGDGAGAMLLTADNQPGIISTTLHADGKHEELLHAPIISPRNNDTVGYLKMEGNKIFKIAVNNMGKIIDETLTNANMSYQELDWLIPHQANTRIIQSIAKKLKMPMEQVIVTIAKHANTSAASVPLAFDSAVRNGKIKKGDNCIMVAFGGGLTWGSCLVKY
jgi:3-oxoacyl-[acyl-carrier-protein] synthase-3